MFKVGITGGMGSGKTTVAKIFTTLGIPVLYADDIAKKLMHTDPILKVAIQKLFGEDIYEENILNRKKISEIVFKDAAKLTLLNNLVHPATQAYADTWMKQQNAPYLLKEAAILFESGSNKGLDYVIGVSAPLMLRLDRIVKRDNTTIESAEARMAKQMPQEEKMKLCDAVIVNDENQSVLKQVLDLHQVLLEKAGH